MYSLELFDDRNRKPPLFTRHRPRRSHISFTQRFLFLGSHCKAITTVIAPAPPPARPKDEYGYDALWAVGLAIIMLLCFCFCFCTTRWVKRDGRTQTRAIEITATDQCCVSYVVFASRLLPGMHVIHPLGVPGGRRGGGGR